MQQLPDLPASNDEYWEDAEVIRNEPIDIPICAIHTKGTWMDHIGYIDNKDGTISCDVCPWGTRIPGYLRVHEGKIVDLRSLNR